jgi:selenocysteine-specific elongation factor
MNHFIVGVAGHIDHGKTALIKALTNIDCDTHPEEKKRGITINLGFAHLSYPSGEEIGIIDFPGHKDFISKMTSGACGIEAVIMVVAANEGIKPQTIEHFQITSLLKIKKGIIVITKIDLINDDELEVVKTKVKAFFCQYTPEGLPHYARLGGNGHGHK